MPGREKNSGRFYDPRRLNRVFAVAAMALLTVTVWMVIDDYKRPWKRYQVEFRERERQMLERRAAAERQGIDTRELARLRREVSEEEARLAGREGELRQLEKTSTALERKLRAAETRQRATRSRLDAARYELELAMRDQEPEAAASARAEKERLEARLREDRKQVELYTEQRDFAAGELEEMRAVQRDAEERLATLGEEVGRLESRASQLEKGFAYYLRNAPLLDMFRPDLKIEQLVVPGLYHDLGFSRAERVDRCVTCHLASHRPGFEGDFWPPPFRSHPRLDLFLGPSSPHPYREFGCSACHHGLDRATDFARAGHSPASPAQEARWQEELDWQPQPFLEMPILPAHYSQAGCVTCHAAEVRTPAAEVVETGRQLASHMGCYVCHRIDLPAFDGLPRPGPSLLAIAGKTTPGWAYRWIEAPREIRSTTWMPHFFLQPNASSEPNRARQRAEIVAAVTYLWQGSERPDYPPPPQGDPGRGEALFETVGCTGCHIEEAGARRDAYLSQIERLHGPNLTHLGSKVTAGWLYAWLRAPRQYHPQSRMPDLRLEDQEAADLSAYLLADRDPALEDLELPAADSEVRDELVLGYLQSRRTLEQSVASLEDMGDRERDVFLGRQVLQKYGCWGCHEIDGLEGARPIGVELTEVGSKPVSRFDFGHLDELPRTRHDWIRNKLLAPRSYDEGKEAVKGYDELLRMPDFGMSEREARALVTLVLGLARQSIAGNKLAGQTPRTASLAAGRRLITVYNCRGCHLIEGEGQAIRSSISDVGLLPPNLAAEGARVRSDWLFAFLHDPSRLRVRPWLTARMPDFAFADVQLNALVSFFAGGEQRDAFVSPAERAAARELAIGGTAFVVLQCARCHSAGGEATAAGISSSELAPSLSLARGRLRFEWVPEWIRDPQLWIPDTKMPANFPKTADGGYSSPLTIAIDAPMFEEEKAELLTWFESEEEMKRYLADALYVSRALRDHIWWNLD